MSGQQGSKVRLEKLYIGWRGEITRPELVPEHRAPSNYKSPDAIKDYLERTKAAQDRNVQDLPGPASLAEVVVLDSGGNGPVFSSKGPGTAEKFQDFLLASFEYREVGFGDFPYWVRAIRAQRLFELLAYDLLSKPGPFVSTYALLSPITYLRPHFTETEEDGKLFGNPLGFLTERTHGQIHALTCVNKTWFADEDPVELGTPMADAIAAYRLCHKLGV